jgi:hypothetical protein
MLLQFEGLKKCFGINPDFTDASLTEMSQKPTGDTACRVQRRYFSRKPHTKAEVEIN